VSGQLTENSDTVGIAPCIANYLPGAGQL